MASPQLENGFIKISNEVLDNIIKHPEIMRGALFPVIGVVWRKTWGWNKKEDAIAISQFVEATGYSKRTIIYALQELEAKNILIIKRGCHRLLKDINIISFNKDHESWVVQNSAPQVKNNRGSAKLRKKVVQNSAKKVKSFAHTKDIKYNTKNIIKQSLKLLDSNQKDMSGFNRKSDDYEEGVVDYDSGVISNPEEEAQIEARELNKKIRHNLSLVEDLRGLKFGVGKDMNFHVKIYRSMLNSGWSHQRLIEEFIELINSDFWKEKKKLGQYPGTNTLQAYLRNKQPS